MEEVIARQTEYIGRVTGEAGRGEGMAGEEEAILRHVAEVEVMMKAAKPIQSKGSIRHGFDGKAAEERTKAESGESLKDHLERGKAASKMEVSNHQGTDHLKKLPSLARVKKEDKPVASDYPAKKFNLLKAALNDQNNWTVSKTKAPQASQNPQNSALKSFTNQNDDFEDELMPKIFTKSVSQTAAVPTTSAPAVPKIIERLTPPKTDDFVDDFESDADPKPDPKPHPRLSATEDDFLFGAKPPRHGGKPTTNCSSDPHNDFDFLDEAD
jgi:hypothetical protein